MPITDRRQPTADVRNIEAGLLLLGAGALLLLGSLFLNWYRPALDAWTAFEAWDLVLAAAAVMALVAVFGRIGFGPQRPSSWLVAAAAIAFVVVLVQLINPPPTAGLQDDLGTGIWLALGGATLMALGAVLSVARISMSVNITGSGADRHATLSPHTNPVVTNPVVAEPAAGTRRRFERGPEPAHVDEPVTAGQTPPTAPTRPI